MGGWIEVTKASRINTCETWYSGIAAQRIFTEHLKSRQLRLKPSTKVAER